MKNESLGEAENNVSQNVDTDPEMLSLSSNTRFWQLFDRATQSKNWTPLDDI